VDYDKHFLSNKIEDFEIEGQVLCLGVGVGDIAQVLGVGVGDIAELQNLLSRKLKARNN
jgi:hypothetical protein